MLFVEGLFTRTCIWPRRTFNVFQTCDRGQNSKQFQTYHHSERRRESGQQSEPLSPHQDRGLFIKCSGKSATESVVPAMRGRTKSARRKRKVVERAQLTELCKHSVTLIDLPSVLLQLLKPVCFAGGGEVMLSKWTKSFGSSSSSSYCSVAHSARSLGVVRACVRACVRAP